MNHTLLFLGPSDGHEEEREREKSLSPHPPIAMCPPPLSCALSTITTTTAATTSSSPALPSPPPLPPPARAQPESRESGEESERERERERCWWRVEGVGESVCVGGGGVHTAYFRLTGGNSDREMKQRRTAVMMMTTVRMWRLGRAMGVRVRLHDAGFMGWGCGGWVYT